MGRRFLRLLLWILFVLSVARFAKEISIWFPCLTVFLSVPFLFLFTYILGEIFSRFMRERELRYYLGDSAKKGAGFVAFSFFVATCIWAAQRYIGGQVNPAFFAIILYFIFRNVRLIGPKRRRWSI